MLCRILCGSMLEGRYSWLCEPRMGGGALSLLGSNIIDLLTYLGFGRAVRVHANLRTLAPTTDNIGQHFKANSYASSKCVYKCRK